MPKHDRLDELDDEAEDWMPVVEHAVYLLEGLTAATWEALREITHAHVRGHLSFEAWRAATWSILVAEARSNGTP